MDGQSVNISYASTFLWESADEAAAGLRARLLQAAPPASPDPAVQLHLGFALSQAGRFRAALGALGAAAAGGSHSAPVWRRALVRGLALRRSLDLDFVEIGCSQHRTVTLSLPAGSVARGLAVEPVARYLAEMLAGSGAAFQTARGRGRGLPGVVGVPAAVDGAPGRLDMYYLAFEDVGELAVRVDSHGNRGGGGRGSGGGGFEAPRVVRLPTADGGQEWADVEVEPFLTLDHFGCNRLGAPHPQIQEAFSSRGLVAPWRTEPVQVLTYGGLLAQYGPEPEFEPAGAGTAAAAAAAAAATAAAGTGVGGPEAAPRLLRVGLLKVDVEGRDLAVVKSALTHCAAGGGDSSSSGGGAGSCPLAIQFESLAAADGGAAAADLEDLLGLLARAGYQVAARAHPDVYLTRAAGGGGVDGGGAFAWAAPLGLVVDGAAPCGSPAPGGSGDPAALAYPVVSHPFAAGVPALACLLNAGADLPGSNFPLRE